MGYGLQSSTMRLVSVNDSYIGPSYQYNGSTTVSTVESWRRSRSGGPVPRWKEKIARGVDASSSMAVTWTDRTGAVPWTFGRKLMAYDAPTKKYVHSSSAHGNIYYISDPPSLLDQPAILAKLDARAKIDALAQAAQVDILLGASLGEWHKTQAMLVHPFESSIRLLRQYAKATRVARGRWREGKKLLKALQDAWLEFRFGWRPLYYDVGSAMDALETIAANPKYHSVSGIGTWRSGTSSSFASTVGGVVGRTLLADTSEMKVKYKGVVRGQISGSPGIPPAFNTLGLTVDSFLPTAWELIPGSFIADWFIPIGEFLQARAGASKSFVYFTRSVRQESSRSATFTTNKAPEFTGNPPSQYYAEYWASGPKSVVKSGSYSRTGVTSELPSVLDLGVSFNNSPNRDIDIAALVSQMGGLFR